jgi:hypothetical protein
MVSTEGCVPEWGVYLDLGCYSNTRRSHKGKGQGQVKLVEDLIPGSVDILILGC